MHIGPYRVPHIAHQAQRGGVPPNAGSVARSEHHSGADCLRRERNRMGRARRCSAPRSPEGVARSQPRQAGRAAQNAAAPCLGGSLTRRAP